MSAVKRGESSSPPRVQLQLLAQRTTYLLAPGPVWYHHLFNSRGIMTGCFASTQQKCACMQYATALTFNVARVCANTGMLCGVLEARKFSLRQSGRTTVAFPASSWIFGVHCRGTWLLRLQ